jgi:cysteinyl-tRNA synthetase
VEQVPDEFREAMDDDLNVPQALGVLHETVRAGNAALDTEDFAEAALLLGHVIAMASVLGINPLDPAWSAAEHSSVKALSILVDKLLDDRQMARKAGDFATADRIRDELGQAGVTIEDTPSGAHWSFDG